MRKTYEWAPYDAEKEVNWNFDNAVPFLKRCFQGN